jgi:hypothetical protein
MRARLETLNEKRLRLFVRTRRSALNTAGIG